MKNFINGLFNKICLKKPNVVQPSIYEASSSSEGIARKKPIKMTVLPGMVNVVNGKITPQKLLISSRLRTCRKTGKMATTSGKSRPIERRLKKIFLPLNLTRENMKASGLAINTTKSVVVMVIMRLFLSERQKSSLVNMLV